MLGAYVRKKVLGWMSLHIGAPFGDLGRERWMKGTNCIGPIFPFSAKEINSKLLKPRAQTNYIN
jgi:hypothetical protein